MEKIRLYEISPGGCAKGKEVEYSCGISVPSVPPTDLTASSVCRVKYEILVNITFAINNLSFYPYFKCHHIIMIHAQAHAYI